MKVIAIGDIHDRDCWKSIDIQLYDKIIFLGDYLDSNQYTDREAYGNLLSIIELKNKNPNKIELLLGNHDMHYILFGHIEPCSGFSVSSYRLFRDVFLENKRIFNVAYQAGNYIFSHAGISNQWWNWINSNNEIKAILSNSLTISDGLNILHRHRKHYKILHSIGKSRGGQEIGGIVWADISDTIQDSLKGLHQVVGHSKVDRISSTHHDGASITYIDVLDSQKEFFEVELGK